MRDLLNPLSTVTGLFLSAVFFVSSPLLAAATETMPMAHHHGVMIDDPAPAAPHYDASGQIKAWHDTRVSIAHSAIPALNWPPMTMTFTLPDTLAAERLPIGTAVTFSFSQTDQGYLLTAISAQQP